MCVCFFANWYYRAETCLWLLYMQNWSVFTEDNIVSSRRKKKQWYKALEDKHMLLSYHSVRPTLFIWKSSIPVPAWAGCTHGCGADLLPVSIQQVLLFPSRMEQISPFVITNSTRDNLVLTDSGCHLDTWGHIQRKQPSGCCQEKLLKERTHPSLEECGAFHVDCRESTW